MCRQAGIWALIVIAASAAMAAHLPCDAPDQAAGAPVIVSPYRTYSLRLDSFAAPASGAAGLILKTRIDRGPVLRLLLDSGAQTIVLDQRAAARSGHFGESDVDLVGVGQTLRKARIDTAGIVAIGDLALSDCGLLIVDGKLLDGIDGVIPLSLFAGFLVRLDIPGRTLDLQPYPSGGLPDDGTLTRAHTANDLLFIKAVLNDSREGYLLLDTGASYSAISERVARELASPGPPAPVVPLEGGAGRAEGRMAAAPVHFRLESGVLGAEQVVVLGLDHLEKYNQLEGKIAGILGYPALRDSVLTISYRDALVGIGAK